MVVFTPMDTSDSTWDLMRNITEALPSTENIDANITFGFCDGSELIEDLCGGPCDKRRFLEVLDSFDSVQSRSAASECRASLSDDRMLVTISNGCSSLVPEHGVCVKPPRSGFGTAYLAGSDREFPYKDMLDILALLIGGSGTDAFGKTGGEKLYDYKNELWNKRMSLAAEIARQRMLLVSGKSGNQQCRQIYSELSTMLCPGTYSVCDLAEKDYTNPSITGRLAEVLGMSRSLYQELVSLGCEYYA
jgi:hypothetical protein